LSVRQSFLLGLAEALRRAMLAMIDKGKPHEAHPAYWAPFVVVGEGAVAQCAVKHSAALICLRQVCERY
jgi:hypothetical protein